MPNTLSRRAFLASTTTALAAPLAVPIAAPAVLTQRSPNEAIRLAGIGVGGKGWTDINGAARFGDIVAYCDVETGRNRKGGYGAAAEAWPQARGYTDWRKLIESEHKHLDGITVSTPDHMHAPVTMTALQHGLAVYTQKPLTRTVYEARALTRQAAAAGVSTQMGNQHHSGAGYRTLVKIIQQGLIGKIKTAHAWSNRPVWPQGLRRPVGSDPVPTGFNWDAWLGVAPERPFKRDVYHPFKWRGWYDFGAGALGDMGCHIIDPVVWSLQLAAPLGVQYHGPKPFPETFPESEVLAYRFAGTEFTAGEITMKWWDGGRKPTVDGSHVPDNDQLPSQGVLLVGTEGSLVCAHGKQPQLYPLDKFESIKLPSQEKLDHYGVWTDGIRTGKAPNSSFAYAGPLTETVLLGVIASRVPGDELQWDAEQLRFTNSSLANRYVREDYRRGWEVPGLSD